MAPTSAGGHETALLLRVPGAEAAVARHRLRLDSAAADGIPAHVTVLYPFIPADELQEQDHMRLERLFSEQQPLKAVCTRTSWFGDRVLSVQLDDPEPTRALTARVLDAYPAAAVEPYSLVPARGRG